MPFVRHSNQPASESLSIYQWLFIFSAPQGPFCHCTAFSHPFGVSPSHRCSRISLVSWEGGWLQGSLPPTAPSIEDRPPLLQPTTGEHTSHPPGSVSLRLLFQASEKCSLFIWTIQYKLSSCGAEKNHLIPDQPKLTYFHTFLVIVIVIVTIKFVHWLHTVVHSLPKDRLWKKSYMDQVSNNFADLDTSIPTNFMTSIN